VTRPPFDPARARRRLLGLALLLFAAAALLTASAIELFGYQAVRALLDSARPWATAVKWIGLTAVIVRWREFIDWAAARWSIDDDYKNYLISMRWKVAAALLALELLLAQNLVGRALG